jgi:two-component system OmpR family sensor kinase
LNSKKREFLISISIIFTFSLIIILYLNYFFISLFGLNQESFVYIIMPLVIVGLIIFLSFSMTVLKPLFKSDEKLEQSIKETIHELNIPVSTIKMNTQLLEKTITDEKSLKRLERIKQASNNLLKLYENMEYNIKKEIDKIDKQEIYLDDLVKNCVEKFYDIKKDVKISMDIPKINIFTDLNGFEKTIDNLISNAIKYNVKDNPLVEISYKNSILSIFNTGEQIDTKNLFIVFDKYFQEDTTKDGFGLGLAMVKEFCDKNKISINIDTTELGNQFNLNLKNIIK